MKKESRSISRNQPHRENSKRGLKDFKTKGLTKLQQA